MPPLLGKRYIFKGRTSQIKYIFRHRAGLGASTKTLLQSEKQINNSVNNRNVLRARSLSHQVGRHVAVISILKRPKQEAYKF